MQFIEAMIVQKLLRAAQEDAKNMLALTQALKALVEDSGGHYGASERDALRLLIKLGAMPSAATIEAELVAEFAAWTAANGFKPEDGDANEVHAMACDLPVTPENERRINWLQEFIDRWEAMENQMRAEAP